MVYGSRCNKRKACRNSDGDRAALNYGSITITKFIRNVQIQCALVHKQCKLVTGVSSKLNC